MERRFARTATTAGINGDYYTFNSGIPSGILMHEGQVSSPPSNERASAGVTTDGTLEVRRVGSSAPGRAPADADPAAAQPAAQRAGCRPLHAGLGADHAGRARRDLCDPLPLPGRDPELGPRRSRRRGAHGRSRCADPARRRGPRRHRLLGRGARGRGAARPVRDGAPPLPAGLARRRLRDRRRPADRARRRRRLPRRRAVHDQPARPARSSQRRRPARRRADHPRRRRRPAARVLGRDDQLRARPDARAARRRDGDGARQRRLDDDGVRRHPAQPPLASRSARSRPRSSSSTPASSSARRSRSSRPTATASPTSSRSGTSSSARPPSP